MGVCIENVSILITKVITGYRYVDFIFICVCVCIVECILDFSTRIIRENACILLAKNKWERREAAAARKVGWVTLKSLGVCNLRDV